MDEAELLAGFLNRRLRELGSRVNLIVNYDNLELGCPAAPRLFEMVQEHDRRYFLSSTRVTEAFLRRKLGRAFADARLSQQEYGTSRRPPTPFTSRRSAHASARRRTT